MNLQLLETEDKLNILLPKKRVMDRSSTELLAVSKEWSDMVWAGAELLGALPLSESDLIQGLQLIQNPVFICGVHRSGTTLVRDLLDDHPELVVLPSEGTYYTNLEAKILPLPDKEKMTLLGKEWLRRLANPINQAPYWLLGRSTETMSLYVDFARYLMAWWNVPQVNPQTAIILAYASCTNKLGAKAWVDKTPTNERFLKRIWQEMPNAKIIHVIREPLATMASRKKMEPTITLRRALRDLKASFNIAVKQSELNDQRFLLVRYEELCDDPEFFIRQITPFLDINDSAALSKPTVAGMPARANSSFDGDAVSGQILKRNEHQQSEVLSKLDKRYVSANIGPTAAKLNYPVLVVSFLPRLFMRIKYCLYR